MSTTSSTYRVGETYRVAPRGPDHRRERAPGHPGHRQGIRRLHQGPGCVGAGHRVGGRGRWAGCGPWPAAHPDSGVGGHPNPVPVPVRIIDRPGDADRITDQLSENLHRAAMHEAEVRDGVEQLALLAPGCRPRRSPSAPRSSAPPSTRAAVVANTATRTRMDEQEPEPRAGGSVRGVRGRPRGSRGPDPRPVLEPQHRAHGAAAARPARRAGDSAHRGRTAARRGPARPGPRGRPARPVAAQNRRTCGTATGEPVPEDQWPHPARRRRGDHHRMGIPRRRRPDSDEAADEGEADDDEADEQDARLVYVPVWVCTDPAAAGLRPPVRPAPAAALAGPPGRPTTTPRGQVTERRTVIANNKAWKSAEVVRREWLAQFITRRGVPAGAEPQSAKPAPTAGPPTCTKAMEHAAPHAAHPARHRAARPESTSRHPQRVRPAGHPDQHLQGRHHPHPRRRARRLGKQTSGVHTWRNPTAWDARIMTALTGWGYQASDVEALLLTGTDADSAA